MRYVSARFGWNRRAPWLLALAAILTAACGDDEPTGVPEPPDSVPESQLTFLRQDVQAPALVTYDTTVIATAGQQLDLEIRYAALPGQDSGEKFLEFELDDESLLSYPPNHPTRPGQLFSPGDTVWIRVVVDPQLLIATFEPSGLTFNPTEPAEVEIRYGNADDDYDDDGESDPELEVEIDLWRQGNPGDDWERSGDLKDLETDRVRAFLNGFSRYGLGI
jgi:hypothetical protein